MGRGYAHCRCSRCGKEFDKELFTYGKGASKALQEKIEWAENGGIDLCTECWAAEKKAEREATPVTLTIELVPLTPDKPVLMSITGNTTPKKEEIKAHGFHWSNIAGGWAGSLLLTKEPDYCWQKCISIDALSDEAAALDTIVERVKMNISDADLVFYQDRVKREQEHQSEVQKQLAALQKPVRPAALQQAFDSVEGKATWNCKVYGSSRNGYSIYISGNKFDISTEDKAEIDRYLEAKEQYAREKRKITGE